MKQILFYSFLVLLCSSCIKQLDTENYQEIQPSQNNSDSSFVEISFKTGNSDNSTKSGIEDDIYNLNIFIYNKQFNILTHTYLTSGTSLNSKILNGDYEIYCIANYNRDLADITYDKLKVLRNAINNESSIIIQNQMLMSAVQVITIHNDTQLTIPLKRLAAKATFNISMTTDMAVKSKIAYIQLCSVNYFTYYFADSRADGYVAYNSYNVESQNLQQLSKTYYVMENKAGINPSITAYYQKTEANAPAGSTYLFVRILQNGKYIDYRIYLGENITNDFNICRNKNYTYNIRIIGSIPSNAPLTKSGLSTDFSVQTSIEIQQ